MKTSEVRNELLGQHAGLRDHLDAARLATERWSRGELSRPDVHAKLAELGDALRAHHLREERALSDLIRSIDDDFGGEEHAREHRELHESLARVSQAQDPSEGGRELERFCAEMLAHMTWEERAFLNSTVPAADE